MVTHDPRLFEFADRIVHIQDGSLTREQSTDLNSISSLAALTAPDGMHRLDTIPILGG